MHQPALSRAVPIAAGAAVLIAGLIQLTPRKAHHLACCRAEPGSGRDFLPDAATAWRHGLRLARHCVCCCGNLMAIPLVVGVMDLRAMGLVTAAITAERLLPAGERVARVIGVLVVAAGVLLVARVPG
jgi:predicted metal-binding membrane protein